MREMINDSQKNWNYYMICLEGLYTSVHINSNTLTIIDSTGFGTLCFDFDRAHGIQVYIDYQSRIKYPL
jgi:hypothetical protein